METQQKTVLTIATGKQLYIDMAVNLARSFFYWNKGSTTQFLLVTDRPELIKADILERITILSIEPGELGEGFSPKLYLDKLAPQGQTLFIDSDCLIFKNLDFIFKKFLGHPVSVVGGYISQGEWFGDVQTICADFNIKHLPKFNGGIYYLEKGTMASKVYQTARELEAKYDEIGFKRLRTRPNDEVLMALSMQLNGMEPIIDDGSFMSDPQACPGGYKIDVIKGKCWLVNPPFPHPLHQDWYPFEKVEPAIFHFLGYFTQHYPYKREVFKLSKVTTSTSLLVVKTQAYFLIECPRRITIIFKNLLRPIYRYFFGARRVQSSERI